MKKKIFPLLTLSLLLTSCGEITPHYFTQDDFAGVTTLALQYEPSTESVKKVKRAFQTKKNENEFSGNLYASKGTEELLPMVFKDEKGEPLESIVYAQLVYEGENFLSLIVTERMGDSYSSTGYIFSKKDGSLYTIPGTLREGTAFPTYELKGSDPVYIYGEKGDTFYSGNYKVHIEGGELVKEEMTSNFSNNVAYYSSYEDKWGNLIILGPNDYETNLHIIDKNGDYRNIPMTRKTDEWKTLDGRIVFEDFGHKYVLTESGNLEETHEFDHNIPLNSVDENTDFQKVLFERNYETVTYSDNKYVLMNQFWNYPTSKVAYISYQNTDEAIYHEFASDDVYYQYGTQVFYALDGNLMALDMKDDSSKKIGNFAEMGIIDMGDFYFNQKKQLEFSALDNKAGMSHYIVLDDLTWKLEESETPFLTKKLLPIGNLYN